MILEFDGPAPCDDEVAAILGVLGALPQARETGPAALPAWRLAALLPDLTIEELRAVARCDKHVP